MWSVLQCVGEWDGEVLPWSEDHGGGGLEEVPVRGLQRRIMWEDEENIVGAAEESVEGVR